MNDQKPGWRRVLADAETSIKNVYATTFFSRRHISIVDQQARSFNLCHALSKSGLISKKTHVGIIGGGFSGLTCAVALSARHDCIVHVFDSEDQLLRRFRGAGFRYIHPELNDRVRDILQTETDKATDFPFLNWSANYAPFVVSEITRKFEHYAQYTNIALHLGTEIIGLRAEAGRVELQLLDGNKLNVDIGIIATGFGKEKISDSTKDTSYWNSGNPESYEPVHTRFSSRTNRILISGNGDSAVIELAHYLIRNFDHKNIFSFLPSEDIMLLLGDSFRRAVFNLSHSQIESGAREFPDIPGPISWYWWQRNRIEQSDNLAKALNFGSDYDDRAAKEIYLSIDRHLAHTRIGQPVEPALAEKIESKIGEMVATLASYDIRNMIAGYKFKNIFYGKIAKVFRRIPITVIGKTPTVYSSRQAPMNWFLLGVLERFAKFKYIQGRLKTAKRRGGVIEVVLDVRGKPRKMIFDTIVVRNGPDYRALRNQVIEPNIPAGFYRPDYGAWVSPFNKGEEKRKKEKARQKQFFRTARWKKLTSIPMTLDDEAESESVIVRQRFSFNAADKAFLVACCCGFSDEAEKLYRRLKRAKTARARLRHSVKLDNLRFRASLALMTRELTSSHTPPPSESG